MKITLSRDLLLNGLRLTGNVVSSRTPMPVLLNVLFEAEKDSLCLSATDLEVAIRTSMPAFVQEPGRTTLPSRKITQIVGALAAGDVALETDEQEATSVSCGPSFFKLSGLSAAEFPSDTGFEEDWSFPVPGVELRKMLAKVSYATSEDETRHVLNGVLLSIREGMLTVAATDGRRLAMVERPLEGEQVTEGDVILPAKVVSELGRMLEGLGDVKVRLSASKAEFSFGGTILTTRLVEGTYPNYRQVVPSGFAQSVAIPRVAFADALNRVSMVVTETSSAVKVTLKPAQMVVSAISHEVGEAKEPLEVSYEGEPLEIAFNPLFFVDPLRHLECDQLIMQFNDEYSPVAISGDEGFLYVVMPMRG
ncbi:MAG: DNA polymerase III subunit beta [Lentisphaeria bacterium]|nr:DNA polymerase III subunit beta [Lentisphaeria bacterium]